MLFYNYFYDVSNNHNIYVFVYSKVNYLHIIIFNTIVCQ